MNRSENACHDDRLRLLLQAEEESHDVRLATQHVDECARCQSRLEQLAADQAVWREAQAALTAAGCDQRIAADIESPWRPSRWNRRPTAWTESMAQQLLAPPSHPEMLGRKGNRQEHAVPSIPSTATSGQANGPDPATAWDAAASDIDIYREDVTPFEMRSQQLWDVTPELKQE